MMSYDAKIGHIAVVVALILLLVGGLNWGVVGLRMMAGAPATVPDALSWGPRWLQITVYMLVAAATLVVVGFWSANKMCETCKCSSRHNTPATNPAMRMKKKE